MFGKNRYKVSDLYVAYPGLVTREDGDIYYNKEGSDLETIVVTIINNHYVRNILNNRKYGIFHAFYYIDLKRLAGKYMVDELVPLEKFLEDKTKKVITRKEIIAFLYPEKEEKEEEITFKYQDIVLQKIYETNNKMNASSLGESEKDRLRKELVKLANYYVSSLKELTTHDKKSFDLSVSQKSIIGLKQECMAKLVEIEMSLPPETINSLMEELALLEADIKKKVLK